MPPKKRSGKGMGSVLKTTKTAVKETIQVDVLQTTTRKSPRGEKAKEAQIFSPSKQPAVVNTIPVQQKPSHQHPQHQEEEPVRAHEVSAPTSHQEEPPEKEDEEERQEDEPQQRVKTEKKKTTREGVERQRKRRRRVGGGGGEGYKRYVYRVMKQVHPEMGISSKAMTVVNNYMSDMFERLAAEAATLADYTRRRTLSSREVQGAVKLVLPGELGRHAMAEGTKAVSNYVSYKAVGGKYS